jgi:hypothetical protein
MRFLHRFVLVAATLMGAAAAAAQTPVIVQPPAATPEAAPTPWTRKLKLSLGVAQSSFTSNWAGDEVGSFTWLAGLDGLTEKQFGSSFRWQNTLVLQFGQTHQQDAARQDWLRPLKSSDKIDFDSFGRFTLGKIVDPFVALTFDSQFYQTIEGYGTRTLNPFQVGEVVGVARAFYDTPSRSLISRLGFGLRQTVNRFGGEVPGIVEHSQDGGIEWRTVGRFAQAEDRTVFKTDLTLFQALFFSESELDPANRWKTIDVRWQNTLTQKITKYLSFDLYLDYVFNDQVRRAGQLKQTLGVSLGHTF